MTEPELTTDDDIEPTFGIEEEELELPKGVL